jgi:hypothetical protein
MNNILDFSSWINYCIMEVSKKFLKRSTSLQHVFCSWVYKTWTPKGASHNISGIENSPSLRSWSSSWSMHGSANIGSLAVQVKTKDQLSPKFKWFYLFFQCWFQSFPLPLIWLYRWHFGLKETEKPDSTSGGDHNLNGDHAIVSNSCLEMIMVDLAPLNMLLLIKKSELSLPPRPTATLNKNY